MMGSKQQTPRTNGNGDWLSPKKAAEWLDISVDTIYDACADRGLRHVKLGHSTIRIRPEWLEEWALSHAR
jgi:excisionase family DNA binding protein